MRIKLSSVAERHLQAGYRFYESQSEGLGDYFLDSLMADVESLHIHAGVHAVYFGYQSPEAGDWKGNGTCDQSNPK